MFTGRNIIASLPEELIKVVNYLNGKAANGEFNFSDSFTYWEDNENIIRPLGLKLDGGGYYFAVALAYIAHKNGGIIEFLEEANVWRWAWSLNILAAFGEWTPVFMGKVMTSFAGQKDDIDGLMSNAAHTYGRTNYDNGLLLMIEVPQYRVSIMAGLMENDFARYCSQYPPKENPEEYAGIFLQTYQLKKEDILVAFDLALGFENFVSPMAMAFFLKAYANLTDDRKSKCGEHVKALLVGGSTLEYVNPVTNWAFRQNESTPFMEECILALVQGLGKENSNSLAAVDNAVGLHHKEKDFLEKLIICVAENLEPTDVLKLEESLHSLYEDKEEFLNMVLSFVLHPKGMYRLAGRKMWDDYHLETSDFKVSELDETLQIVFIISMLQDFGNPERRLPKLLPLLMDGSEKVRSSLMRFIHPYVDEYMGHVTNALDEMAIDCEEAKVIRKYVDERADVIKARREMKELSPMYTHEKVFREAIQQQNKHMQEKMKEADAGYKSIWKELFATVMLARGGGWRDEKGKTQHLPLTTFSVPSRIMAESMSPKEQDEWLNQLLKDWDDTTGNN